MNQKSDEALYNWTRGADAALRRAAVKALELGLRTNTPVYVLRDGKIVDLTKESPKSSAATPKA